MILFASVLRSAALTAMVFFEAFQVKSKILLIKNEVRVFMSNILFIKKSDMTVTIFIDSHMAVGSYNWLSAARHDR